MDPIPVFDGHNDTLLNLLLRKRGGGRSFFERSTVGHVDLPRALEGGFGGGFHVALLMQSGFLGFLLGSIGFLWPPRVAR